MEDSLFQTFLLIAYFDIALLSITIANYAVSASYLGRETRLSRSRMERRKQKLVEKLRELRQKEPQIDEIKKEIKEFDGEAKRLSIRIFLLSWLGAVIAPSTFFLFSLLSAVIGMNSEMLNYPQFPQFLQQQLIIFSLGTISIGFMILLLVVRAIDSAARKIPVPEFDINFEKGGKKMKCKSKERKEITVCLRNKGEDVAEDVEIFTCFPPSFVVHENNYIVFKQGIETDNPDYTASIHKTSIIHTDITVYYRIILTMPENGGIYEIPVEIHERKIGAYKDKLIIEIVE